MHETHSMPGARFFGGDRRLRPHHHHHHHPLKCPRCDSLNTKFCYYNNYHLSQPRHFCKTCRRYWTKGGVLRNVPVGGASRKTKRSNKNSSSETETETETTTALTEHNSTSHSSSESSNLTPTTEAVSPPKTFNSDSNNNNDSKLFIPFSDPTFKTGSLQQQQQQGGGVDCSILSEIGSFTSSITSTNDTLQYGFGGTTIPDASSFWQHQKGLMMNMDGADDGELKFPDNLNGGGASLLEQGTIPVDISGLQNKTGHGGFGSLDWHGSGDQGLFDLSNTVDHTYWSDHDNSHLFHLP